MMKNLRLHVLLTFATLVLLGAGAATARADILIVAGNNPQGGQAVQFTGVQSGSSILGTIDPLGLRVSFQGSEPITNEGNSVEALRGGFNRLTISVPGGSFTSLTFNADAAFGSGSERLANFTVTDTNGLTVTSSLSLARIGDNFFTIMAGGGQRIFSVQLITTNQFGNLREALMSISQIGIGGSQIAAAATTPMPEPATMLLLGTGLAGVTGAVRRRRRAREIAS